MKWIFLIIAFHVLIFPEMCACYPVQSADNCNGSRNRVWEISGVIGGVLMGEKPFLTLIMKNGDEFIMMAEDAGAVEFFKKNAGKQAVVKYQDSIFLFADDFSENGPGVCERVNYFKSAKLIK